MGLARNTACHFPSPLYFGGKECVTESTAPENKICRGSIGKLIHLHKQPFFSPLTIQTTYLFRDQATTANEFSTKHANNGALGTEG